MSRYSGWTEGGRRTRDNRPGAPEAEWGPASRPPVRVGRSGRVTRVAFRVVRGSPGHAHPGHEPLRERPDISPCDIAEGIFGRSID